MLGWRAIRRFRAMGAVDSTEKINGAIGDCLTRCYSSPTPVLCLTEYLKSLLENGDWRPDEVAKVRSAAVRILRNIAAPEEDDGLPLWFSIDLVSDADPSSGARS
jgi:hypothetical protein